MSELSDVRAYSIASSLDVGLDGVCLLCLSIVSIPLERGDEAEVRRELRAMTPDIWADGLRAKALPAARRAVEAGTEGAAELLADLERNGGKGAAARAIVRRLAAELVQEMRTFRQVQSN
jgi:hypothetical protein